MLNYLPRRGKAAELGVNEGDFSKKILNQTNPEKLVLIDPWNSERYDESKYKKVKERFRNEISSGQVAVERGYLENKLSNYNNNYFDWVYIDTTHSYEQTRRELEICKNKVRPGGYITGHDYCEGDVSTGTHFDVIRAVNEFCVRNNFELRYLTLPLPGFNPSFAIKI